MRAGADQLTRQGIMNLMPVARVEFNRTVLGGMESEDGAVSIDVAVHVRVEVNPRLASSQPEEVRGEPRRANE